MNPDRRDEHSCPVGGLDPKGAQTRLQAFADGTLAGGEHARWMAHLDQGCHQCDALFASDAGEAALVSMSKRTAVSLPHPPAGELASVFRGVEAELARGGAPKETHASRWSELWRGTWLRPALSFAMLLAVVAPITWWVTHDDSPNTAPQGLAPAPPAWRAKSAGTMAPPALHLFHGRLARDATGAPRPKVLGALQPGTHLALGDAILFRVGLSQACDVTLSVLRAPASCARAPCESAKREHLLHARLPAGEHELTADGLALAYIADRVETLTFRLAVGEDARVAQAAAERGPRDDPTAAGSVVDALVRVVGPPR